MKFNTITFGIIGTCLSIFLYHPLSAQEKRATLTGTAYETVNGRLVPLRQATLSIQNMGISLSTDGSGKFEFKDLPTGKIALHGQFVGKVSLDTAINLIDNQQIQLVFRDNSFRLDEVGVTAEASSKNAATSSVIGRAAIEHLQANSLADVMSLMPGARASNPDLTNSKQINIRQIVGASSDNFNAFGTSIIVNGAPTSNNANMQVMNPVGVGLNSSMSGGASAAGGIDVRNIPIQNIESVEVIRGIPSVEYGDVASGAVIVNQKAGKQPLTIEARTNPNLYSFMANQGIQLAESKGALNLGADYSYNVTKPEEGNVFYQRATFNTLYSRGLLNNRLSTNTALAFNFGKSTRKQNPDDERTFLETSGKEVGFNLNTNGTLSFTDKWLKNIRYTLSGNYQHKDSYLKSQYTNATAPYSMTYTDGAVLSNRPGQAIYDADGNQITNIPAGEESLYAVYLPATYVGEYGIDGREFSGFAKAMASFFNKVGNTQHKWVIGADFKYDKNFGDGKQFVDSLPPIRNSQVPNSTTRKRTFREVPGLQQFGLFAQENFTAHFGAHDLNIEAGIRYDLFSGGHSALSPRINANFELIPNVLTLRGGYGLLAKAPSLTYLHPERAYFEYVNINELASTIPADQQLFITTTRVFDTENSDLKIAKNKKSELGFDLQLGKSQLRVTGFQEQLIDGYSYSYLPNSFQSVDYIEYKRANANADLVGTHNPILSKYFMPNNTNRLEKKGVEMELHLKRIDAIRTQFSINGMYLWRKAFSSNYTYYDSESGLGATNRTHVGLYAPDMEVNYHKAASTSIRATHNIPSIGLAITLTAETIWNDTNWKVYGNDSIPLSYISKYDGQVYDFDPSKKDEAEFKNIVRKVSRPEELKESLPAFMNFNINITKEIRDIMRVSFFANNMFRSYPNHRSDRVKSEYISRNSNNPYFFGLNLALIIK
ncbi:TonB-dependent receptor plug domain-containing protein [Sphingobacterium sp. DK4209]|uniref:TonB-dependent receptor plug domain-containing protein n=1 Tax=Sphingobacterium zhuxiongii TaxID=2662364 RepID=A0A5Q0QBN2_9SPHI|nr:MULTISPECIES: TonB-dependent receptor plug domain-containing protein [unclassified Sphingobacterium]MVZ66731.1 TonB-dependent receptor plug domain-containing protein [Sphingobacterium sp. DK4209]QGA26281.1 TonB-dependent receptor plug domain-containing protein [Sphingobacterium sp. dk4302]